MKLPSSDKQSISEVLDARRLAYFVAVAETLHFRRAAERLRIAQPALSQQIRRLEQELGCQLLQRDRRRVELTPAGLALFDSGRRALAHLQHAGDTTRRTAAGQIALLRVGFLSPAAFAIVPDVLRRVRLSHPDVYVVLREGDNVRLLEDVRLGALDVAFVRGPATAPGVRIDMLRREPLVVVLPTSHRLARRARVAVSDLADEAFIGFPRESAPSLHDASTGLCFGAGFAPSFVTEASEWYTIVSLVAAGVGVAIMPASIRTFRRQGAVYRPIAGAQRHVELSIARRYSPPGRALRACLQAATQITGVELL